jgi:hypothetical protein
MIGIQNIGLWSTLSTVYNETLEPLTSFLTNKEQLVLYPFSKLLPKNSVFHLVPHK